MQSMNEELQTVNHELHSKVDELSRSNNDMKNLLNSTDIATLFLDGDLCVRRFTTPIANLIKLIPSDAGRPITDIARDIEYLNLADDAREVLRTLVFKETLVAATQNRWFTVRIMPYRTLENVIDGLVITFTDASATKALEVALLRQASELKQMFESLPDLVWKCRSDGACDYLTARWSEYTGVLSSELLGYGWLTAVHADDRERVRNIWREAVRTGGGVRSEFRPLRAKDGTYHWFRSRAVPIRDEQGRVVKWFGANADIDDLRQGANEPFDGAERGRRKADVT
jgi:two-component system CheB/CheR fusion protein